MKTRLKKIDLEQFKNNKKDKHKFEEIALKISETILPEFSKVDDYIGLEHIDSEDIHIRRKGTPEDVKGGKLKCYKDDIIFGKRRAYLRKAAIVNSDAICSAHAFVFRAKKNVISNKLFPFFFHSDQFMHRMIDISVGGLSPTINWSDLKNLEFLLPLKKEQDTLAELLWSINNVIEHYKNLYKKIIILKESIQQNIFQNYNKIEFKDEYSLLPGYAFKSKDFIKSGIPVLKIKNINESNNSVDVNGIREFVKFEKKYKKYLIKSGDLIVGLTGAKSGSGYVGKLGEVLSTDKEFYLNQRVAKIISNSNNTNSLTKLLINSSFFLNDVWRRSNEGAQANISTEDFCKCLIPDLKQDKEKYNKLSLQIYKNFGLIESNLKLSKNLQKNLINSIFS